MADGDLARRRSQSASTRLGVVDVGSNSVRLVVFGSSERSPAIFFNEKVLCGLGADLNKTGRLSPEGRALALGSLRRFASLARHMGLGALDAVGTAALREAEDGPAFVEEAERIAGVTIRVASGQDEARLAAQGVLLGDPRANGVVADIGGASMELTTVGDGFVGEGVTAPLGPLRLGDGDAKSLDGRIAAALDEAFDDAFPPGAAKGRTLYILGGSWRAFVKAHMAETDYPLPVLHGYALGRKEALEAAEWAAGLSPKDFAAKAGASDRRAEVAPRAARVLAHLIRRLSPERVTLSAYGLREGVLWEYLSPELRAEDPLIHAARAIEAQRGRMPGFGDELWGWLAPLFPELSPDEARMARAGCLLADSSWEADTAFRSQSCFDLVTRNNFGGIDPPGRVFIGAILLYRYKGGDRAMKAQRARKLLSSEARTLAERIGRGVRLGAMLSGAAPGVLPNCPIALQDDALILRLSGRYGDLDGDELRSRLSELAKALGAGTAEVIRDAGSVDDARGGGFDRATARPR
ncbi:MAG: Ppx/GppA family phosphatase [Pseudomonadota bacterium]